MTIKISFVVPAYVIHWTEYESRTVGKVISSPPDPFREIEMKVRMALETAGCFELPDTWLEVLISGVTLELSGNHNVTLSKCLFSDHDNE